MIKRTVFVPHEGRQKDTAVLLVGTAREFGISQRSISPAPGGFLITEELAGKVFDESPEEGSPEETPDQYDPADYTLKQVTEFVSGHPDLAEDILASELGGKNRSTLVKWLDEFTEKTSGNRAVENHTSNTETE